MIQILALLLFVVVGLTGCPTSPGPVINNSGDGNQFGIGGAGDNSDSGITSPTPVIVPPVVVTNPEPEPEA